MTDVHTSVQEGAYTNKLPYANRKTNEAVWTAHRNETRRLEDKLKADLEEELGLTNHPKKDVLWRLAWERGHSAGYGEVASYYEEMAELLT